MLLRIITPLLFSFIVISSLHAQKWSELAEQGLELEEIEQELETYLKDKPARTQKQEWKQFNRWKILAEMAGYGEVDPVSQFYDRWETAKRFKQEERNGARNNFGTWESVTPDSMFTNDGTPNYGVIQDIEFDRLDNSILYVGTHGNGLLRRNADGSWDDLTFGLPIRGVSGIVAEGNRITILTGSKRTDIFRYHGLFISEDYGATWELRDIFEDHPASIPIARATYGLRVHPLNYNIQYALTGFGVYFTDDAWQSYSTHSTFNPVFELVFNPLNYGEIYYSSDVWVRKADFDFQNGTTVYQNSNAFRILVAKSSDPPYSLYWTEFLLGRLPLPNNMETPDTVKVYHSSDDINFTLRSSNTGVNFVWQIWNWNWAFTVNPNNNNHLVFGSRQVFQSFDGGNSFATMGWVGNHDDQHDFEWRSGSLFAANDGGVSYNTLFGLNTWETDYNIGLRSVFITNIDAHNNKLIGGFWHAGSKIWDVGDNTALQVGSGDGFKCFYDNAVDNSFYYTTQGPGFINQDTVTFRPDNSAYWGQPFFQDPQFPDYLWFAQNRVYFWHKNSNTFTDVNVIPDTTRVHRLAVCASNSNRGYAAFHQVEKFMDFTYAGAKIDRASFLPIDIDDIEDISHIEVDQLDPDKLWITLNRYNESTVFYSDDRGVSWEDISLNLPQVPIYKMVRVQSNNQMYLATEYGVYYKNDSMSEWIRFSNGLGYQRVVDLVIDTGYIYASLFGPGVFRSPLRTGCPAIQNVTATNYANPLDPSTLQLEAFDRITSNIHLRANIGTNVKLAGGNYVNLIDGFRATSIVDTVQIEGIQNSLILINTDDCRN